MIKRIVNIVVIFTSVALSQIQWVGVPILVQKDTLKNTLPRTFYYQLTSAEIAAAQRADTNGSIIGVVEKVQLDVLQQGEHLLIDSIEVYRLRIHVKGAGAVGITFQSFYLPKGAKLYCYNIDRSIVRGAYDYRNNKPSGQFAIVPMEGEDFIIELDIYPSCNETPVLKIDAIMKIIKRDFYNNQKTSNSDCFVDVHCVPSRHVERGVVAWGGRVPDPNDPSGYEYIHICSGCLINQNVNSDNLQPYVITARHCTKNSNLNSAFFVFHYRKNHCFGNIYSLVSPAGEAYYSVVGATELEYTKVASSDISLLRLNVPRIPPDYNVHYAGWDRNPFSYPLVFGIHHPGGLQQKISMGLVTGNFLQKFSVAWNKINGAISPTKGGSSGSPLFKSTNNAIIGVLSGGTSGCSSWQGPDFYGKLRYRWKKKWKPWLDPYNTNASFIDGRDPCYTHTIVEDRILYPATHYQPTNQVVIQAGSVLETRNVVIVESGASYKFTAGNTIILKPGFHAKAGSHFVARIESCDAPVAQKPLINQEDDTYSNSLTTSYFYSNHFSLYPIPAQDVIHVQLWLPKSSIVMIEMYQQDGKNVYREVFQGQKGQNKFTLPVSSFSRGIYLIRVTTSQKQFVNTFLKL